MFRPGLVTAGPQLAQWVASSVVKSDASVLSAMVLDANGTLISHERSERVENDFGAGVPMLVRLPRFGFEVFVRLMSEEGRGRVYAKVSSLSKVTSGGITR